jgi:hypothetical protein
MKVCGSDRQAKGLALVCGVALVVLGMLSGCHKEGPVRPTPAGRKDVLFPACAIDDSGRPRTIVITPGDTTNPPTVSVKACAISPNEKITWACKDDSRCKGWRVIFNDPSVDDRQLFQNGAVTFGDIAGGGQTQDSAVLVQSDLVSHGPIVVKYTVQTAGSPPADPHIIPMGP